MSPFRMKLRRWSTLLVLVVFAVGCSARGAPVHLAVFLAKTGVHPLGSSIWPAASLAVDAVNRNASLLPDHELTASYYDTACEEGRAFVELVAILKTGRAIDGIIGGGCDRVCEPFGELASRMPLPIVSWGCHSAALSDKRRYSTLARTVGPHQTMLRVIFAMLRHFRWNRIGILFVARGKWAWLAGALRKQFKDTNGGFVRDIHTIHVGRKGMNEVEQEVRYKMLKHIVLHLRVLIICADAGDVRDMMMSAKKQGMMNGDYIFITINLKSEAVYGVQSWMGDDERDEEAIEAFQGLINVAMTKPDTDGYKRFEAVVAEIRNNNNTDANSTLQNKVDVHAGYLYDAVMLYAHALHGAVERGYNVSDGRNVASFMYNMSFQGLTNRVFIDKNGDAVPPYGIKIFQGTAFKVIASYSAQDDRLEPKENVSFLFPGGRTTPPPDSPPCGWQNENCVTKSVDTYLAISLPFIAVLLFITIGSLLVYRKIKFELEVNSEQLWRIKPGELLVNRYSCSKGSRLSMASRSIGNGSMQEVYAEVATYKGTTVCLTKMTDKSVVFDRQLRLALKQDVLGNDDIRIGDDFKLSFALDICKGMEYLHKSAIEWHGRLKSSNCVIDNRWTCMVTDYGIGELRMKKTWINDYQLYSCGSKAGDVYSYAIILQEIAVREEPFCMINDKHPKHIIEMVMAKMEPPFRPVLSSASCKEYMITLMTKCWQEAPENRPTFTEIKTNLKSTNNNKSFNILDNMIKMMEQYANHLEDIVFERTQLLEDEKKKTDKLLYEMLPKQIAEDLKVGKVIHPMNYDQATVYFSDVVGFNVLVSESSPLQIVDLLNDLYTTFDNIIDNHDVYKVETTDDAYMVVSGVPVTNGNNHAAQVASLALDTLSSTTSFRISHKPDTQLRLRIGMHSGPVVAGVIGLKMPRYCLFGDTVNTASRMMSNGAALRIHMSRSTSTLLEQMGGYDVEERGEITVKGKGKLTTYWLLGKHGFDKPLPEYT